MSVRNPQEVDVNNILEHFVLRVQELSNLKHYGDLAEFISTASQMIAMKTLPATTLDTLLETFNDTRHSLGVLYLLNSKATVIPLEQADDLDSWFIRVSIFIPRIDRVQIKHGVEMLTDLCHRITVYLVDRQKPFQGIDLLIHSIKLSQNTTSDLTEIHGDLCQLCLLAKCFKPALEFLDADIMNVVKGKGQAAKSFLLYFYYGGMIYTALKKYDRALFFFEAAITVDAVVVSHIVLEAYKKRILVSLISKGKVEPLPKWTSSVVERFAHQISKVYHDLESVYESNSVNQVREFCMKNADQFSRDGNTGLVKQCVAALCKKNIKKLTKTFLTLSLTDVAQRCELASAKEAERHLFNMIEDGEIYAFINQKDGMVIFKDNPNKYNNSECFVELEKKMRKFINVNNQVRSLSELILMDATFIQKSASHEDDAAGTSGIAGASTGGVGSSTGLGRRAVTLRKAAAPPDNFLQGANNLDWQRRT